MSKVRDLVTSTEKLVPSTRRTGRSSFAGFRRADEEEKRLAKEEKHRIEVEKIAREATIFNEKVAEKAARIKAIEDEEKRVIKEQNRIIRTDFINDKMSNAFGTKTKIDSGPTRQSVIDNILPKAFVPEQTYPEPFEEEPLLNKELADFKKKINEHLHKMGFASGSGGGEVRLEFLDDIDSTTAKVNNKFLKYQSSTGKWIGSDAAAPTTITVTDNESTNEHNAIVFVADADLDGGTVELESDGDLKYNPNSGTVTATTFSGALLGNATTATALATGRTIAMTGDVTWTSASFDGSGNVTATAAIGSGVVVNADINSSAAVAFSKMENLTVSRALVSDSSGDVSISNVTSSEVNMLDGGTSATGTTLAGADRVITNDNGTMVQVALTDFDTYFDSSLSFPALSAANTFTATQSGSITALSDGANISVNLAANNHFSVTLAGNRTLDNPTNIVAGTSGSFFITQDGTGSRTLSYGSYYDFAGGSAPTLTTTASKIDRIDYIARTTTSLHCVFTGDLS